MLINMRKSNSMWKSLDESNSSIENRSNNESNLHLGTYSYYNIRVNGVQATKDFNMKARPLIALAAAGGAAGASFVLLTERQWPRPAAATIAILLAIAALYLMLITGPLHEPDPVYE